MVPVGPYKLAVDHSSGWFVIGHSGVAKVRGELDEVDAKLANDVLTGTGNVESVKSPAPGFRTTCRRRTSPPAT
jgi:polyisoprenoid-binding protein YceI